VETLTLGKTDFDEKGKYLKGDLSFNGHIHLAASLGLVLFDSIVASGDIIATTSTSIKAGGFIEAGGSIEAGRFIEAGGSIEAGRFIEAGGSIEAGRFIEAGRGIKAGLSITCRLTLSAGLAVFAGVCLWKTTTVADRTVTCATLKGTVEYGIVKFIPADEEKGEYDASR